MLLETSPLLPQSLDRRPFHPRFVDGGASLARLLAAVRADNTPAARASALDQVAQRAADEIEVLSALERQDLRALVQLRACALVLRDLARMGWHLEAQQSCIQLSPPNAAAAGDTAATKAVLRQVETTSRDDQLSQPSVRRFIHSLESPGRGSKCLSVTRLIADGAALYARLAPIAAQPMEMRAAALREVVKPYLQLVTADVRCEHTGIRLTDIWRYFRLSWSTPYKSQPGRNMFFLIRDAAQPFHPVMGIAALGNAMMQQSTRDDALGWTVEGLAQLVKDGTIRTQEVLPLVRRTLKESYDDLCRLDLPLPQDLDDAEPGLADELLVIVEAARKDRKDELEKGIKPLRYKVDEDDFGDGLEAGQEELLDLARTSLFRAKRAKVAADLVRAWTILRRIKADAPDEQEAIAKLLGSSDGRLALSKALQQSRNRHAGSSIMELVVCGGVAPYSHLLSGKLVCLLMTSPEVAQAYARRYERSVSIIASQLKGEPVVRPSSLVYLGTTSLYAVGTSQYNRVVLPAGTVPGQRNDVRYEPLGETVGYGAIGLSVEAMAAVQQVAVIFNGNIQNVNYVFGEGANSNMRMLREGFDALGLARAELLRHARTRLIYGVRLASNLSRYLLGLDQAPEPMFNGPSGDATEAIVEYWRSRWLARRLDYTPALQAVAGETPLQLRVSRLIPRLPSLPGMLPLPLGLEEPMPAPVTAPKLKHEEGRSEFIRRLYRDENSFSDHVNLKTLQALHIKTDLERVIRSLLERGASVVLTGNAGDGKTHLLRMLGRTIKETKAFEISDASAVEIGVLAAQWADAAAAKRPCCIAINEGPLFEMLKLHRDEHPFLGEVERLLHQTVSYEPVGPEAKARKWSPDDSHGGQVFIFDLSLRQNLSRRVVKDVLKKLTEDRWYDPCPTCQAPAACPVTYNKAALSTPSVQERICDLLEAASLRGERYTYRELLGFVSFLIYGDRTCAQRGPDESADEARYYHHAFEGGEGRIFDQLRRGLDPVSRTHPTVDAQLWGGAFDASQFAVAPPPVMVSLDEPGAARSLGHGDAAMAAFKALKRRWYFEHPDARRLDPVTEVEALFEQLGDRSTVMQLRVGRLIGLLNRFRHRNATSESALRLWTSLTFSSRSRSRAMVSGSEVPDLSLYLYRPRLAPHLEASFGEQAVDHLLLGPADERMLRFANLRVDLPLLSSLASRRGSRSGNQELLRRVQRFNDALATLAKEEGAVRTIWLVDGRLGREIRVRVDLQRRRYASMGG